MKQFCQEKAQRHLVVHSKFESRHNFAVILQKKITKPRPLFNFRWYFLAEKNLHFQLQITQCFLDSNSRPLDHELPSHNRQTNGQSFKSFTIVNNDSRDVTFKLLRLLIRNYNLRVFVR